MQQQKEYFNELFYPITVSLITSLWLTLSFIPRPFSLHPSSDYPAAKPRGTSYQEFSPMASLKWAIGLLTSQHLGAAGWGLGDQRPLGTSFAHPSVMGNTVCKH